jgi:hypothetical protein
MSNNFDIYEIEQDLPDHNWRTEVPNIIFEMGLDCFSITLYTVLKKIAGDGGICYTSNPTLCELSGMKETKLRETLKDLSNGNNKFKTPLISITPRLKTDGSKDTNIIRITPIWRLNGTYFRSKLNGELKKTVINVGGTSPNEPPLPRQTSQGTSPREDKEDPSEENPFEEECNSSSSSFSSNKEIQKTNSFISPFAGPPHERPDEMDELDLSEALELKLIKEHNVEKLKTAIRRTLAWKTRTSDEAGIMAVLKNFDNWNDYSSPEVIAEENKKHLAEFKYLDSKKVGIANVSIGPDYMEFVTGPTSVHVFNIKDRDFKKNCDELIKKLVSK